ncbi:MAG TPA: flagellar export chaperone FliS [Thermotogota bacterium]|nr:flagellar export chaperone FliS [Thermotogota bacterium]HRW92134.1 flagellar export chaperone FliS [Thermotogota bacterium]
MTGSGTYSSLKQIYAPRKPVPVVQKEEKNEEEAPQPSQTAPASAKRNPSYLEQAVGTASPAKLVEMLYAGALNFLEQARHSIENQQLSKANEKLIRVQDIIMELNVSLDMQKGGEIAENLRSLYSYMFRRLLEANGRKDVAIIEEISGYLKELHGTWVEAMKKEKDLVGTLPDPTRNRMDFSL